MQLEAKYQSSGDEGQREPSIHHGRSDLAMGISAMVVGHWSLGGDECCSC